ncbi:MAG: hypothetical protein IKD72_04555 [Clostridia bacterium]|nr:hypothetical protein [Clostridia bacterium]
MKRRLLNAKKTYPPQCAYCGRGRPSPDGKTVLCVKQGMMQPDDRCRSYVYDPLRRQPQAPLTVAQADPADFEL